ncbi:hypothetical protein Dsin_007927 [Dipteronia sinensis]|uniref:Uncharacterized protein n=1 Tax=Dipteronia sinensis TaxID=43782 RepID=A0AAE0B2I4_9ROSI|nr:hypothetical protein Dsin_007927 [Dipteronia sinensis]
MDLHSSSISFFVPDLSGRSSSSLEEFKWGICKGVSVNSSFVDRWRWSRLDVSIYTSLVQGLAASLKVSNALRLINYICRVGVSPGEEVPFGKVVRCPTCLIAVAFTYVDETILLLQIVSCAKCRYKYELVSGEIVSIDSEEIRLVAFIWLIFLLSKRGLRFLQIMKQSNIPTAVHSIVVQTPSMACTHKFSTETVDLPQKKKKKGLIPLLAVLATGDAVSGIVDPSLPQFLSVAAVTSLPVGTTLNTGFPQLSQLPRRSVEVIAIKQQLLSQYDLLQSRIKDLKEVAEKELLHDVVYFYWNLNFVECEVFVKPETEPL